MSKGLSNQKVKEITDDVIKEVLDEILSIDPTWRIERFDSFEAYQKFMNCCRIRVSKVIRAID